MLEMRWHHRFQYVYNALMAGDLDRAADGFGRLPEPEHPAWALARETGQAGSLVTWNAKDFDCGFIRKHAIRIMDPDEYLCALYEEFPNEVVATIAKLAACKRRPPMTPVDLVDTLDRAGVGEFAPLVLSHLTPGTRQSRIHAA